MSESHHQAAFFSNLAQLATIYPKHAPLFDSIHASINGAWFGGWKMLGPKMIAQGMKKGVWDVFVPAPCVHDNGGICGGLYIEFKYGRGRLTKEQKRFRENLRGLYQFYVAYSWVEATCAMLCYTGIQYPLYIWELAEAEGLDVDGKIAPAVEN